MKEYSPTTPEDGALKIALGIIDNLEQKLKEINELCNVNEEYDAHDELINCWDALDTIKRLSS